MTKEEFLRAVALHDKKSGNYIHTTQHMEEREKRLDRVLQPSIDLYGYLVGKGYEVFVMELLKGNGAEEDPTRWTHFYIPEINTSIRMWGTPQSEEQAVKTTWKLRYYLRESRKYYFTFIMYQDSDIDYIEEKLALCRERFLENPREGVENNIVIPPKKKRKRIKVAPTYEKIEYKPKFE